MFAVAIPRTFSAGNRWDGIAHLSSSADVNLYSILRLELLIKLDEDMLTEYALCYRVYSALPTRGGTLHIGDKLVELFGIYAEAESDSRWKIYTPGEEAYVTTTWVNDMVAHELDQLSGVRSSYVVWLPPAFAALLALQRPEYGRALMYVAGEEKNEDTLLVPDVMFMRPDHSFCWRVSVGIDKDACAVTVVPYATWLGY